MKKNERKCSSCGEIIDNYSEFCIYCGAQQPVPNKKEQPKNTASSKPRNKQRHIDLDIEENENFKSAQKEVEQGKTIEEQKEKIKTLEEERNIEKYNATHDIALTGLLNREAFEKKIAEISDLTSICLISIDANDLKTFNDSWGHEAGDYLLKTIGSVLNDTFSDDEDLLVYRNGGDEFSVICLFKEETFINKKLSTLDEALSKATEEAKEKYGDKAVISISIGVAYGKEAASIEELRTISDQRMYENKKAYKEKRAEETPLEYINKEYDANFDGYYNDTEAYIEDLEVNISKESIKKTIILIVVVIVVAFIWQTFVV